MPDEIRLKNTDELESRFVLETDEAPEFWQFLNGLRGDDLLVELIVNELDARSPHTEIRFEPDRLVCVGAGEPIDEEGWARLRKLKGAGHKVPAKKGLFGVKNHGLKACFTLGNDIIVRSSGRQILQTLFSDGPDQPAYPGVRVPPLDDPDAPAIGTRIEVPYRVVSFRAPQGEPIEFPALDEAAIDAKFLEAAKTLPRRLLGIIRPLMLRAYTLKLTHHRLGTLTLEFRCGPHSLDRGLLSFSRSCRAFGSVGIEAESTYERAALVSVGFEDDVERPVFFRSEEYRGPNGKPVFKSRGLVLEAAWPVESSGRLRIEPGKLRYPVAYPADTSETQTGLGMSFSAPFASDAERHEPGPQSKAWNSSLIAASDMLVSRVLNEILLPKFGPAALTLIDGIGNSGRLTGLISNLLNCRALPAVDVNGHKVTIKKGQRLSVPTYTWDTAKWSKPLALVCPVDSPIIDPRTPATIVAVLSGGGCVGWNENHLRFDEIDVCQRMKAVPAEHFPWQSEAARRKTLGNARGAALHLDAIEPMLEREPPASRFKPDGITLPDAGGALHPFECLKRGVSLPEGLLDVNPPPILHPQLKDHKVFKLSGWKIERYGFSELLATGEIGKLSIAGRHRFFGWLAHNSGEVRRDDWPAVKALPIWPSASGEPAVFEQLCSPKNSKLAALLGNHILRPARQVQSLCAKMQSRRARLSVRTEPSPDEVSNFFRARMSRFAKGIPLADSEREQFKAFEEGLLLFGVEGRLATALRQLTGEALALNRAGVLSPLHTMVRPSLELERLALGPDMVLDRDAVALDRIFPPLKRPSWQMVARSLRQDPGNKLALLPRLSALVSATADPVERRSVEDVPCIPVDSKFLAPRDIAFKGNTGDYWGAWKTVIGGGGLSDEAQDLYRAVGVIRSHPEPHTSRAFFSWLAGQSKEIVAEHLPQVVRHISHKKGITAWWLTPPEIPCIPVEDKDGVRLLTISQAVKLSFIDDFPELADEIRSASPPYPFKIGIHSVRQNATPIADDLRAIGIPSLRESARGPLSATRTTELEALPELQALLERLQSDPSARRLRKQLQELDVPLSQLEIRWQNKLAAVQRVRVGADLRAEYRIGRRIFFPKARWAVLPAQKELWLNSNQDLHNAFFGAVADLVFAEPRPRYMPAVLKAALDAEVREFQRAAEDRVIQKELEDHDVPPLRDNEEEISESLRTHPAAAASSGLLRNKPKPSPLHVGGAGEIRRSKPPQSGRPQVVDEDVQRRELKENHYAWHCQIELAHTSPQLLAPPGSYVEFQENRQRVVEAHHPDKVTAGGPRNAGNLLILSHLNHERFGKAISRQQITDALLGDCEHRTISAADGSPWVEGIVVRVEVPVSGEKVAIFFTHHHRHYWLEMAGHQVPVSG